ncbi:hypothetical protein A8C56_08645 [Niabella ginsenosidivorans]|uniref:Uncharacterized protein n=1 Tax=Niabella ginsenosidivorans TaxID=1176587 RepID=A0A1A9I067_9BACT|nr:hypothetical protein A8C56_08645 [Niabella ginsenosidivorans]
MTQARTEKPVISALICNKFSAYRTREKQFPGWDYIKLAPFLDVKLLQKYMVKIMLLAVRKK